MNSFLRVLLVFSIGFQYGDSSANWSGRWEAKGADVIIGLSTDPQNPDFAKNSFLIIGYSKKFNCSPVVSVLTINGQRLGSPLNQKTSKSKKNQLVVTVGSREFSDETKLTEYSNGMELAMRGSQELVDALSNAQSSFSAKIGTFAILNFSKAQALADRMKKKPGESVTLRLSRPDGQTYVVRLVAVAKKP